MPGAAGRPGSFARKDPIDDNIGGGIFSKLSGILGGSEAKAFYGTEEETQGLLGLAQQGLQNVTEKGASALGGGFGGQLSVAMQVAAISRQQWMGFFIMLGIGCLLMALSFASLPMIVLAPQKFAVVFTTGSMCFLGSFIFLKGVSSFTAHLTSRDRLPLSAAYIGSMAGTLWASMWYRSTLLTMVFSAVQISQLLWFFVSYIPGGATALGWVQDAVWGVMRRACCGASGNLPL